MSKASNLAGFSTSISPPSNLNVGVVTATSFFGDGSGLTGTATTALAASTAYGLTGSPNVIVGVLTATTISAGSTTGTSGQLLRSTGTGIGWTDAPAGGLSVNDSNVIGYNPAGIRSDSANGRLEVFGQGNFQVFTSPGTFTVNPGISSIRVRVVGAGGNGGDGGDGTYNSPSGTGAGGGGGGGGGGYAHKVITAFTAPRSYTVTVGSAPGGTSSFGSEVSATGGSNGSNGSNGVPFTTTIPGGSGGAGGSGSNGDVNFTGSTGSNGGTSSSRTGNQGNSGGAAATQKGNGSGASVPGLPSLSRPDFQFFMPGVGGHIISRELDYSSVNRFPFDIFNGVSGAAKQYSLTNHIQNPNYKNGYNGGSGGNGYYNLPGVDDGPGGSGGIAAGGGGGAAYPSSAPTGGITSGFGGAGGLGAGGGGGGGGYTTAFTSPTDGGFGGPAGSGGSGIVIVEW
jgi:hypothetical protein